MIIFLYPTGRIVDCQSTKGCAVLNAQPRGVAMKKIMLVALCASAFCFDQASAQVCQSIGGIIRCYRTADNLYRYSLQQRGVVNPPHIGSSQFFQRQTMYPAVRPYYMPQPRPLVRPYMYQSRPLYMPGVRYR